MSGAQPLFELQNSWKVLDGPILGLTQPALVGRMRVRLAEEPAFDGLDAAMAAFLLDPLAAPAAAQSPEHALVVRAAQWVGAIQRRYRIAVSERFHAAPEGEPGTFRVCMPYLDIQAAHAALSWVKEALQYYLANGVLAEANPETATAVRQRLKQSLGKFAASPNVFRFLRAADENGIPVTAIAGNLSQFGLGRSSRMLLSSFIDTTGVVGVKIAGNKLGTATVLRQAGLPAPVHGLVADEAEARAAAARLGYPVVVKPNDKDQGKGVAAGLMDEAAVSAAFAVARKVSPNILVEKHFEGSDYRLTVFEDRVLQVIGRRPGGVTGDGRHSLRELVDREAALPDNRRREWEFGRKLLLLDEEALDLAGAQGLAPDTVVENGQFVRLRRRSNVSSGGTPYHVPAAEVHSDNLELAVRAAQALRLNLAGIDLIIPDIARSWLQTGALICEVNAQPQISQTGSPRVYTEILETILGGCPSIPIWLVLSGEPPPELAGVAGSGLAVGASSAAGVWVNGAPIAGPQRDGFSAAKALFAHPSIDAAVVHLTPSDILGRGVPFLHCDVAMIGSDVLAEAEALDCLAPHVVGQFILPEETRERALLSGQTANVAYRSAPWDALDELIAGAS